jgi:catechol 2,3-dioxygenase-like lactoylglutathione lyase family enzyme
MTSMAPNWREDDACLARKIGLHETDTVRSRCRLALPVDVSRTGGGDQYSEQQIERAEMKPRISVLTLGVDDLEVALRFYRDGLGLRTEGIIGREFEHGTVAFFDLEHGLKLAIFCRDDIAHDAGLPVSTRSATEFTIGHNVGSEQEVDDAMRQAIAAGARLVKPTGKTFWGGYAGYFQDPDGHLWEIVFNPEFIPEDSVLPH